MRTIQATKSVQKRRQALGTSLRLRDVTNKYRVAITITPTETAGYMQTE
jgi:hypothetical protein